MKCVCGYENGEPAFLSFGKINPNAFRPVGNSCSPTNIYTQTSAQAAHGIALRYRLYAEEVQAPKIPPVEGKKDSV